MNTKEFKAKDCNYIVHYRYKDSILLHCEACKDLKELSEFCLSLYRRLSFFEVINIKGESLTQITGDDNIRELFKNYRYILEAGKLLEMCESEKEPEQNTVSREEWSNFNHHIKNSLKYLSMRVMRLEEKEFDPDEEETERTVAQ